MTEPVTEQDDVQFPSCYRHPDVEMAVRCTRCERPICPDCMIDADVGFHCPECARRGAKESPTVQAPWRERQSLMSALPVTITLIGLNVLVFLITEFTQAPGAEIESQGSAVTGFVAGQGLGEWWRLFTSMFMHVSILHVGFNMFVLYIFGRILEPTFGSWWFLAFYLASGLVGGAAFVLLTPVFAATPAGLVLNSAVGASGAIYGLFGAMLAFGLRRRGTPQGQYLLRSMAGLLILNLLFTFGVGGIAWQAHLGGFVAGLALGWIFDMSTDWRFRVAGIAAAVGVTALIVAAKPVSDLDQGRLERIARSASAESSQTGDGLSVDARADLRQRGLEVDILD